MALTIVQAGMGGTGSTTASSTGTGAAVLATQPSFPSTIGVGGATASTSGAGITFPATQSASTNANTLDDYEEGTWTPGVGAGITYVGSLITSGTYRKIGSLVYITATISGSTSITTTVAGNAYINGVPFNMAPGSAGVSACGWANATSGAGYKSGLLGYDNMYVGEAIGPTSTVLTISGVYIATN